MLSFWNWSTIPNIERGFISVKRYQVVTYYQEIIDVEILELTEHDKGNRLPKKEGKHSSEERP